MTVEIPEVGQLVQVRSRQWQVADVIPDAISAQRMGYEGDTLIKLTPLEEDALGDSLEVMWEIEPGVRILEQASLPHPTGFDTPDKFEALLDSVRWRTVATADRNSIQSPFRAGIEIEDFQLEPLVRAINMPRVNLLIADDVGLGKTIEAGLVILELIIRAQANKILIVCPAGLQLKWKDEMREKFGLDFRIVDTELMKKIRREYDRNTNPWQHYPRLITSMDYLKRDRPLARFCETLPSGAESIYPRRYDILLIDEAQNVAPAGTGAYATDSQRTQAIRKIAPHFDHRLFLSATPHNGYRESFSALLELLDDQRFARDTEVDKKQLERVMVRRLKSDIPPGPDGRKRFPDRVTCEIEVDYTDAECDAYRLLIEYADSLRSSSGNGAGGIAAGLIKETLKKRFISSPAAFQQTLAVHTQTLKDRQASKGGGDDKKTTRKLKQSIIKLEEEYSDEEERDAAEEEALAVAADSLEAVSDQKDTLKKLATWAERASGSGGTKLEQLLTWIEEKLLDGGEWNSERVVIFTEFRTTQVWLNEQLIAKNLGGDGRIELIYGGMPTDERERIKAHFQKDPNITNVRILIATECASEGIDLQNHCKHLINYDIPFNPSRLEQRCGRIDRRGQRSPEVFLYHFVAKGYAAKFSASSTGEGLEWDLQFLASVAKKLETSREDLGRVNRVLADKVHRAIVGDRTNVNVESVAVGGAEQKLLAAEKHVGKRVLKLREDLVDAQEAMNLGPRQIQRLVSVALELARKPRMQEVNLEGQPDDTFVFKMPSFDGNWGRCSCGLEDPVTAAMRPCTFDHKVAEGRDDVVLIHLEHPLVKNALALLRAEIWSPEETKKLNRITVKTVPNNLLKQPAAIVHSRFTIIGNGRHRLHEEVFYAGGTENEGKWDRFSLKEMDELSAAVLQVEVPKTREEELLKWYSSNMKKLESATAARLEERRKSVEKQLEQKKERDKKDIDLVLKELETSIQKTLDEVGKERQQFLPGEGWDDEQRQQRELNIDAIQRRLERIPSELKDELQRIDERYSEQIEHANPLAVTILVPEGV